MATQRLKYGITKDDLSAFKDKGPAFHLRRGDGTCYITHLPDHPYGWMVRDVACKQGMNTDHIVWAHRAEPMGRFLYTRTRSTTL